MPGRVIDAAVQRLHEVRSGHPEHPWRPESGSEGKTDQTAVRSFLFDENGEDRVIDPAELDDHELNDQRLLWVDVDTSVEGATDAIPKSFAFEESLANAIGDGERVPLVRDFEDRFRVRLLLPVQSEGDPETLDCVVGANWVVTTHPGDLDLLDRFMEPLEGETDLGGLAAPRFLALVFDAVLDRYYAWIEDLERRIDRFDERVIGGGRAPRMKSCVRAGVGAPRRAPSSAHSRPIARCSRDSRRRSSSSSPPRTPRIGSATWRNAWNVPWTAPTPSVRWSWAHSSS
jgi:Mg2+ and Co2+ transporter CorA